MKLPLYFFLSGSLLFNLEVCSQKNYKVVIYGTVRNCRDVLEIEDKDYTQGFQISNDERSFVADSLGRFSIEFTLNEPKYFAISRNRIYLCPGDTLMADIDCANGQNSLFRGRRKNENEYLKFIPYPKAGSFLDAGINIKSTIEETFYGLSDLAEQKRKYLASYTDLDPEFRFLEENRINADLINSFYTAGWYFTSVHKLTGDSLITFRNHFSSIVDDYVQKHVPITLDARLMKLEVYRDVAGRILQLKSLESANKDFIKINDWFFAKQVVYGMRTDTIGFDLRQIERIKTPEYRHEVLTTYKKFLSLNGTNAIDLVVTDVKSNPIRLSVLKGKNIFISIWATWCGPCIKEHPYFEALKEQFKNDPNIAFVYLSIDDRTEWLNYLDKKDLTGLQYNTEIQMLTPYFVSEIPRTILIDKNFKIWAMRGPMSSDPEAAIIINKMLKRQ